MKRCHVLEINIVIHCSFSLMLQKPCEDVFRHPFNPLQKPFAQGIGPIMVYLLQHGYATNSSQHINKVGPEP